MPPKNKERPSRKEKVLHSGILISNLLAQIGQCASVVGLQHAAVAVSTVFTVIDKVQANKKDFQIIADHASDLIIAIWHTQEQCKNPKKWLSNGARNMVKELTVTLDEVCKIALKHTNRNIFDRVIFYMADAGKIRQAREKINAAVIKFQVINDIKVNDVHVEMLDMMKKVSKQIENLNKAESMPEEEEEEEEEDTSRAPRPRAGGSNSASISGFSFSNNGSGTINNQNVGNMTNTTHSGITNKHSENHIYGYIMIVTGVFQH
ncbi:hypothetical protein BYT27DRAFT_7251165 [Phlegmacium glaucopus]|nr:hypothetical protein BYT27DRAFT_7251165 [Phlegmacium glaucopus]